MCRHAGAATVPSRSNGNISQAPAATLTRIALTYTNQRRFMGAIGLEDEALARKIPREEQAGYYAGLQFARGGNRFTATARLHHSSTGMTKIRSRFRNGMKDQIQ